MPKVNHDRLTRCQSALFVQKILVFNSKWLPRLSCVDFQGGSSVVLGRKTQVFNTVKSK